MKYLLLFSLLSGCAYGRPIDFSWDSHPGGDRSLKNTHFADTPAGKASAGIWTDKFVKDAGLHTDDTIDVHVVGGR